jgi:hypothetical protein
MKVPVAVALLVVSLTLGACGRDHDSRTIITTQILSDAVYDGDVSLDASGTTYTVTQGNTQSVFAGIDPVTGEEFRAFLDFYLGGPGGVPLDAAIASATLDIFIDDILPSPLIGTIPIRIDLVYFQPPNLRETDFDRSQLPALATLTIQPPISEADFGNHVPVDVTFLMREAQRLGLPDFQIRILADSVTPGLIVINDTTGLNRELLAPLLEVRYYY